MSPRGGPVRGADADTGALGGPLLPRRGVPYDDSGFRSQSDGVRLMDGNTVAAAPLLDVQNLSVRFVSREATVTAVNGATFSLRAGEVLCLLGESGSGKSVTLRALMRRLLLADEPTTALAATVQIQVLILLRRLQQELGMGTIFVTHDLGVAAEIADRVAVMYAGRVIEEGPVADVLRAPAHPYTAGLLASTVLDHAPAHGSGAVPGGPPDLLPA